MLYYDGINISEEIYFNKIIASKECFICDYCFLDKRCKF